MVFSFLLRCVSTVVGAFFPAFYTFKTLAKPNQRAQIYWLKYWAVFGVGLAVEFVLDSLFITYFIPGYELARLLFILYSVNPVTNGAQSLYDNLLKPLMFKHQPRIDAVKTNVTAAVMDRMTGVATNIGQILFSATVNRFAAIQGLAAAPAMPQRTYVYNVQQDYEEEEEEMAYPIIHEIKDEPIDWDYEDEVEVLAVKKPRTRNTRKTQPVIEVEEEEKEEREESGSGDDVEYVPPPPKRIGSGRGRGRGRGKKN
ncbi:hypothetical protein PENTCL1PPCAC_2049 [Pristionchus entomophagus]|uniref:Receptor expression-enhancing protein n=1 Tax=Pristionchus entomophagus TaxID=358040 RepID=A0AAV5SEN8_9BILA|nr:hypothetical protein PENTCL1PPCAC_2049 [Pristionchus entomophagus]